jgi:hypothetical protein
MELSVPGEDRRRLAKTVLKGLVDSFLGEPEEFFCTVLAISSSRKKTASKERWSFRIGGNERETKTKISRS